MNRHDKEQPIPRATAGAPRPPWRAARAWLARAGLCIGLCIGLAACGSSGSSDPATGEPPVPGALTVTVTDAFGAGVAGAVVDATLGGSTRLGITDAAGVALLAIDWPDGTASVTVTRPTFLDAAVSTPIVGGTVNAVAVTLQRATAPAGGSLASRSGLPATATDSGRRLSFEIELVVVDGDAQALENLGPAHFSLQACTPDPDTDAADCVRSAGAGADAAYTPASATPETLEVVPAGVVRPYAAGLLLDQSGSIAQSDPTGARLFSAKALMAGLGQDDRVLLAAFAGSDEALIPTRPLTLYPPFRDRSTAPAYFDTLDALAPLVGGDTPLYAAIDELRAQIAGDAALPADLAKSIVVFTDGADTSCESAGACAAIRAQTIQAAQDADLRLFTIALSSGVDVEALGELANQTGGALLYAETAEQLLPLYGSVGRMLSLSLPTYRLRWTVDAGAPGVFQPGSKLLGRARVTVDGRTFDVPFLVGVV